MRLILPAIIFALSFIFIQPALSQHSIAKKWNEVLLEGIRNDYARPTVHARNLFHASVLMYDVWSAFDTQADTYFLGKELNGYRCVYDPITPTTGVEESRKLALSYAVYRLMNHRFANSPRYIDTKMLMDELMAELGYDIDFVETSYTNGSAAALGNYMAACMIEYGLQDGSNEENEYVNVFYEPVNPSLVVELPGNPTLENPNRWQPLTLEIFIDQGGNIILGDTPEFLSPEWGTVLPFALSEDDLTVNTRDGNEYWVYHDPGDPAYIDTVNASGTTAEYMWGFALVSAWSSHLDPADGEMIDISPATYGNINKDDYPTTIEGLRDFYDFENGGDPSRGRDVNPITGEPYEPQFVPRGDYGRVLAEFWADGPDSETPPGHWYTLINGVNSHPLAIKKFRGQGPVLDDLEWDVKSYFLLGGAMHDVAICAWGMKGWYDYLRPVSALRSMADRGQSSDENLPSYHIAGIPLTPGLIELVGVNDPLAVNAPENIGKIKIFAWKGPEFINDPLTDVAGVDWILAENWWPYQRPTFITPPFAGYVSGHSTYSRAAAELLTLLTGSEYFPGGMGEFYCEKNEFLVFEDGPSIDLTLQWATYRDASDQCSLSRIWGGIHPPVDDIPGRLIGEKIGKDAFAFAEKYFLGEIDDPAPLDEVIVFPNPVPTGQDLVIELFDPEGEYQLSVFNSLGQLVYGETVSNDVSGRFLRVPTGKLAKGIYMLHVHGNSIDQIIQFVVHSD